MTWRWFSFFRSAKVAALTRFRVLCIAASCVSTGAAGRESQLHAGLRDHRAHASSAGRLAGPGPLQVPAAAGDSVPHGRHPGPFSTGRDRLNLVSSWVFPLELGLKPSPSYTAGPAGLAQEAAAGRRDGYAGGL